MHSTPRHQVWTRSWQIVAALFVLLTAHVQAQTYYISPASVSFTYKSGSYFPGGGNGQFQIRSRTVGAATGGSSGSLVASTTQSGTYVYSPGGAAAPTEYIFGVAPGTGSAWSTFIPLQSVFTNSTPGDNTTPTPKLEFTDNQKAADIGDVNSLVAAPDLTRNDLRETFGADGTDVSGTGVPTSTPDYYESNITLTNTTDKPITYNVAVDGAVDTNQELTLNPGESTNLTLRQQTAFNYQVTSPGSSSGVISGDGGGITYGPPTVVASGSGGGQLNATAPGGVTPQPTPTTQTGSVITAPPTQPTLASNPTAIAGTTGQSNDNANANQLQTNVRLDRISTQLNSMQGQQHTDANGLGGKLDKLLNGTGVKPGDPDDGGAAISVGAGGLAGITGKITQLKGDLASIMDVLTTPPAGSSSWNMTIALGGTIGTFTLDLDQHATAYAIVRALILTLLIFYALWAAVKIMRGVFVEES